MKLGIGLAIGRMALVSSGPAFTPASLSGLQLWLRADTGVTNSGSGTASQWVDQSANGFVMQNSIGGTQLPAITASGVGGNPSLTFSSSGSTTALYPTTKVLLGTTGITIASIFTKTASLVGTVDHHILGHQYNSYHYSLGTAQATPNTIQMVIDNGTTLFRCKADAVLADTNAHVAIGYWDGSNIKLDFDGVTQSSVVACTGTIRSLAAGSDTNTPFCVGNSVNGTSLSAQSWSGQIPEVVVYNRALNSSELLQLWTYMRARAGI